MKLGVASHRSIAPVWETVPIGRAAIRALYAELALHPKPGLVGRSTAAATTTWT